MLAQSDIVTLHCPLIGETRDMFGRREFEMMKRSALLINTARGALVQDEALIAALREGLIAGAATDVLRKSHRVTEARCWISICRTLS